MKSKFCILVGKFRMWGLKGAINAVLSRVHERKLRLYFKENAAKWNEAPIQGMTIVAPLSSRGSVNKVMRDFCFSLRDVGIPYQTFDIGSHEIPEEDIRPILTPRESFAIAKYTHLVEMLTSPVPDGLVRNRGRVVFWEFENGITDAYPVLLERPGDVLAMSDFNFTYYKREFEDARRVAKILYPLRMDVSGVPAQSECRKKFGFGVDDFLVFFNFSLASGWNRKNPLAALYSFAKAFRDIPNAKIVFKTSARDGHEDRAQEIEDCAQKLGIANQYVCVDGYLTQNELYCLTNACDVYLSLHRSEGFGLGIIEAMMLGKAVVVTGYSAPMEFCTAENSFIVPFQQVPVDCSDVVWYATAKKWADPDVCKAAEMLQELYRNPKRRQQMGQRACESIRRRYSLENFRASVLQYMTLGVV